MLVEAFINCQKENEMIRNKVFHLLVVVTLLLGFLAHQPVGVKAASLGGLFQRGVHEASDLPQGQEQATDSITFTQLLQDAFTLNGPYDSFTFSFDLPYEWAITQPAKLNLLMIVSGSGVLQGGQPAAATVNTLVGGTITIDFNGTVIGAFPLDTIGSVSKEFDIPAAAFVSARDDGRMQLRISMESPQACTLGQNISLVVLPESSFSITHATVVPEINLAKFPRPFFEKSIFQKSVVVTVPDDPTAAELQSALTVIAGLANLSGGTLKIDLLPVSQLTAERQQENMIFVGRVSAFPALVEAVQLPLLSEAGTFDSQPDDGIVEMANSPWSPYRVVLLVTGNNETGMIKAAQAVSSGVLVPGENKSMALIKTINANSAPASIPVDQTLSSLGYGRERLTGFGVNDTSFVFYVPPGQTATSEAYFTLLFGHSALIDYDRSGLVVSVNGQPIGSVRLSPETSVNSVNTVKFTIPPTTLLPGTNRVTVIATLQPLSNCNPPDFGALWVNIWPESTLHLPLTDSPINVLSALNLSRYPAPFTFTPDLSNTAIVLQKDRPEAWSNAAGVAAYLGDRANGSIVLVKAYFDGEIPEDAKSKNHFIVIGRPAELDTVRQINNSLPVPFVENSNDIVDPNLQVVFRFAPETPVGYVELLQSPWSPDHVILLAAGNNPQGLVWAASALMDTPLNGRIAGNFSMINDGDKVASTDTRTASFVAEAVATIVPDQSTPGPADLIPQPVPAVPSASASEQRPAWILFALGAALLGVVIVLFVAFYNQRRQNDQARNSEKTEPRGRDGQGDDDRAA